MAKVFKRAERNKYTNEEKLELGELVEMKEKRNMMPKKKRHVPIKPSTGYVTRAVRSFYSDLADTVKPPNSGHLRVLIKVPAI